MKLILSSLIVMLLSTTAVTKLSSQSADTTITVKVTGITCATDVKMIKANIEKLEGISECDAGKKGATTSFNIKYNPLLLSKNELDAAIERTAGCENPNDRPYKVKKKKVKRKS